MTAITFMVVLFAVMVLVAIVTRVFLLSNYVAGIYRHYRGGLYLGLCRSWESDNDAERVRRVLYFSLAERQLDDRTESEFLSKVEIPLAVPALPAYGFDAEHKPRFKRIFPPWQPEGSKT